MCHSCLVCAMRNPGIKTKPLLCPIPISSVLFSKVGIDVLSMPLTSRGSCYALVFVDYFTKFLEAFAISNKTAKMVAKLFVYQIVCCYGVPDEIITDQGANFISDLMLEILRLMGTTKINTTPHHPASDGLVERYHRTLLDMLAKFGARAAQNWDLNLSSVLFTYHTAPHSSMGESPYFLLLDGWLPTASVFSQPKTSYQVDLDDYKTELLNGFAQAWLLAHKNCLKAQKQQKKQYDKKVRDRNFKAGDCIFVYEPSEAQGKAYKLSCPYLRPYQVKAVDPPNVTVYLIDRPQSESETVHADRVFPCHSQIPVNSVWKSLPKSRKRQSNRSTRFPNSENSVVQGNPPVKNNNSGPVTRSRAMHVFESLCCKIVGI